MEKLKNKKKTKHTTTQFIEKAQTQKPNNDKLKHIKHYFKEATNEK